MIFLDTDVVIDVLRGHPPALTWLSRLASQELAISGMVAMELVLGARNLAAQQEVERFLTRFNVVWPTSGDTILGYDLLLQHHLRHNLGLVDSIIAAMALRREERLYTFNLKHFGPVPGLDAQIPYTR